MAETKFTPGPWEGRYLPNGMPTGCVKFGIIGPDGLEVARVWRQEDVLMIAAAPELYKAARRLMAGTGLEPHDCPCGCCVCEMVAVLAKAVPHV